MSARTKRIQSGQQIESITVTGAYTCDTTSDGIGGFVGDYLILCNLSAGHIITLPPVSKGRVIKVKDIAGNAGTNHITITPASGVIDGAATYVITINYSSAELISDGTNWFVTSEYNGTVI